MIEDKRHLFICAIGPVQDFIATARTSQDLWFGSWLLSELSKAAALVAFDNSHQLIFPAPERREDLEAGTILSVANKIVAIVEGDPKMIADGIWQKVQERLENLRQETLTKIETEQIDYQLAKDQINDLVEFYWVSVPYKSPQDYRLVRTRAEALLAARKNTRNFQQIEGQQGTPKSSLDGFRESVLSDDVKTIGEEAFYEAYHAAKGEALSGIDLLKRWGEIRARRFQSTTDLAAQPFLLMLGDQKRKALFARIKHLLAAYTQLPETEGTHFYVERLVQLISSKEKQNAFKQEFAQIFKEEGIQQSPSPYYALLLADGDNMGKTIDAQDSPEKHQALSRKLSAFAQEVKSTIEEDFNGVPIYVGGDDVLAYLPLHTALECVIALNKQFKQAMQGFEYVNEKGTHSPTLSGALVIAHHLTPLSDVLDMARQAEKEAKGLPRKNGLVIVSSKRGGTERTVRARMSDLVKRMEILVGYVRQKQISGGAAYELQKLYQELRDAEWANAVSRKEAIRIIQRKREAGSEKGVEKEVQQQFKAWLEESAYEEIPLTLDELAQEMIIAGEFAGAYDMAFGAIKREVQA